MLAVFATQGTVIGLLGTLGGVLLGILLAVNLETLVHGLERLLDTRFLDASVYFMSDLPAHVEAARRRADRRHGLCALLPVHGLPGVARRPNRSREGPAP